MAITEKDKAVMMDLVKRDSFLVLGSRITKHPFIVWDKEGGEDQIYAFTSEEKFKEKEKEYRTDKYAMLGIKVEQKSMKQFFIDLYSYGVSQIVVVNDEGEHAVKMENVIPKPDFSKLPENQQPLLNPSLEISVLYFLQEFTRDIPMEEKTNLRELEEEMAVNIARSKYLLPVRMTVEMPKDWDGKLEDGTFDIPYLANKEGEFYLPIFGDVVEFNKFNVQNNMQATIVPIEQIQKMLVGKCQGAVLNPASMGFRLMPKTLDNILKKVNG